MPNNIKDWKIYDLELSNPGHFQYLFQAILTNENKRKVFFKKLIWQTYDIYPHEEKRKILKNVYEYCSTHPWAHIRANKHRYYQGYLESIKKEQL